MRLEIEFEEKYKDQFYELIKATNATIIEEELDFWAELPDYVKSGIEKSLKQVRNGQTKTYDEVKEILANRKTKV